MRGFAILESYFLGQLLAAISYANSGWCCEG